MTNRLNTLFVALILGLLATAELSAQYTARANRPSLPSAPAGAPGVSYWAGGLVRAYEDDGATGDDFLGNATVSPDGRSASIEIGRVALNLLLDEWFEGECVEIEFFWTYVTWQKFQVSRPTPTGYVIVSEWRQVRRTVGSELFWICP